MISTPHPLQNLLKRLGATSAVLLAACAPTPTTTTNPAAKTEPAPVSASPQSTTADLSLFAPASADITPGGRTTVHASGRNAFSLPLATLTDAERTRFAVGNSFFRRNWVQAPASTTARDGLGPHFLARSCGGCHVQDGRARPPDFSEPLKPRPFVGLLMRLSIPGAGPHGAPVPDPIYGDQFNTEGVRGIPGEGRVHIQLETIAGRYGDGTPYTLQRPVYQLHSLNYGPMHPQVMVSPRIAPQVIGLGLLEAIPDADILATAAAQAASDSPIKGQPNYVWDAYAGEVRLGRFGWKANVATVAHQTAGAFLGDIGITSSRFPEQTCTAAQSDCASAPHGTGLDENGVHQSVEIPDYLLDDVIFYQSTLAPPARRNANDPQVLRGQDLFHAAQCAQCHRPTWTTAAPPFARLSSPSVAGQTIAPYTDMLLHDMGPELADGRPDFRASGQQWRTPPLWGIGLLPAVNGHQHLLHDGRARGVAEAILWHGGEAEAAREVFRNLSAPDREALVQFVQSL